MRRDSRTPEEGPARLGPTTLRGGARHTGPLAGPPGKFATLAPATTACQRACQGSHVSCTGQAARRQVGSAVVASPCMTQGWAGRRHAAPHRHAPGRAAVAGGGRPPVQGARCNTRPGAGLSAPPLSRAPRRSSSWCWMCQW
ncbi:hypothetical protein E2C01_061247 [Portunus trituberculatus]|uniref:Uncharacterized protein n=1 Tax=Portunus trituberculatus TaxID=210409 RepID=A0A5B7H7L6_PORTR|nr:hypothetical protein [Portunus trituberculatus]